MSNFVVNLARFAASDGVIRLDRRVVGELYCNGFLRARFAGLAPQCGVCTEAERTAFTSSVHTRVDRLPFPPLELAYRQLVLAAHDKCLKADILPLDKKQVSDNVKKRKKAKKAGRAAAAQQQPQSSITNAAAGVSVEAATDASDVASASMDVAADDSDAEAASEGARLSLLSPVVLLGLAGPARSQSVDLATLATPLRPKRKRIAAIRSEPTEVTPEKPSGNMRPPPQTSQVQQQVEFLARWP
jgi:hypothetical protein